MKNARLQFATQYMIERFSDWTTHMLTLTLRDSKTNTYVKTNGWAKGAVQRSEFELTDAAALSTLRYFIEALNYKLHGHRTRRARYKDVCRVLAIPVFEGARTDKRRHFHILLGNVPANRLGNLEKIVADAWAQTKWGMPRIKVTELFDADGASFYFAKEVGYVNDDAVLWEEASIPNRLIGKRA